MDDEPYSDNADDDEDDGLDDVVKPAAKLKKSMPTTYGLVLTHDFLDFRY